MQNYFYDIIPEEIREVITEMVEEIIFEEQELQDQEDLDADIDKVTKLIHQLNFLNVKQLTEYCDTLKIKKSRNSVSNAYIKRRLIVDAEIKNYKYPNVVYTSGLPKILFTRTKKLLDCQDYYDLVQKGEASWTSPDFYANKRDWKYDNTF